MDLQIPPKFPSFSFIDPSLPLHPLFKLQGCDREHKDYALCNSLMEVPSNPAKSFPACSRELGKHIVPCVVIMCSW